MTVHVIRLSQEVVAFFALLPCIWLLSASALQEPAAAAFPQGVSILNKGGGSFRPQLESSVVCRELVLSRGYPCEDHTVTSDGFVLAIQRIAGRAAVHQERYGQSAQEAQRLPVLLMHGLLQGAAGRIVGWKAQRLCLQRWAGFEECILAEQQKDSCFIDCGPFDPMRLCA